jgi:protein required for attachment to host cells
MKIPQDALVFVGDGQKAMFLRNAGDAELPNLVVDRVFTDSNPPTHEQGTDRPGRAFNRVSSHRRSGMEGTDWHELEKHRFVGEVASAMEQVVRSRGVRKIIVVAPARTLADLRHAFRADVKKHLLAEVEQDLTKHPVSDIERHLIAA